MVNCMVKSCKSRGKMPGITYHQIPKKNSGPWFDALKRSPFEYVTNRNFVCSRHFKHDDFSDGIHTYLKPGAIPSQNLDVCSENFDLVTQCKEETPSEVDFSGKFDFITLCKEGTSFEVDNTPGSSAVKESLTENFEEDPLYLKPDEEVPSVNAEEICGDNVNIPYNTFCDNITTVTTSTILKPLLMQVPAKFSYSIITNNTTSSQDTGTSVLEERSDANKKVVKKKLMNCTKDALIKNGLQNTQISTSSTDDPELQKKIVEEYHKYSLTPTKHEKLTAKQTAISIKKKVKAAQRRYRRLERNVLRLKVIVEKLKQKHVCHD